jgi:hypothetical protein
MDEKNGMATLHDVLDAQSSVSAVTCRSPAVRSGATDEKNGIATLHDVLDAQWIYDNPARVSTLSSLPRVSPRRLQACGREGQRR